MIEKDFENRNIRKHFYLIPMISVAVAILMQIGCSGMLHEQVEGAKVKVAKVDTEYIYEANVYRFVQDYRQSRQTTVSNFIGFSPDEILAVRESAIDNQIRKEIRRLPGVHISSRDKSPIADQLVEELAYDLHERLTGGADFAQLAREYSDGKSAREGGVLGGFGVQSNPEPYQERAYNMEIGEISEPFSSWDGWRIIKLDDITQDPLSGTFYHVSLIYLVPDLNEAEAMIIDEIAEGHTIEILDPKYNSRQALINGDYNEALERADEAVSRNDDDDLAHYLRAQTLWKLDRAEESLIALQTAAEVGKVSDALIPYYHFYHGRYLEELERMDEALVAYHESYGAWQQDVNMAFYLRDAFERMGDEEYLEILQGEIDDIGRQDAIALTFGSGERGASGVIATDQGEYESTSAEYEPGYRE